MKKMELKKHKVLLCTKKQIDSIKNSIKWFVEAETIQVDNTEILVVNIYRNSCSSSRPQYRIFQTKEDYITESMEDSKWKTGAIWNLVEYYYFSEWGNQIAIDKISRDKISRDIINKYLKTEGNPIRAIRDVQRKIMDDRLRKKNKKITDVIDKEMEGIKEIPEDFTEWVDEVALFESRYIYYEYKARKKFLEGYCTHCNKNIKVEKPRHNAKGICPNCKSPIVYKSQGKAKNVQDYSQCALIQKINNNLIIRHFNIKKIYGDYHKSPKTYCWEERREIFQNEKNKIYEYGEFRQSGEVRWCNNMDKFSFPNEVLYDKNLEILKDTEYKYSAIKEFATYKKGFKFNVYYYLKQYKNNPFIEYLIKMGLYRLVKDLTSAYKYAHSINENGKSIVEVLELSKESIRQAQRLNINDAELNIMQKIEKEKKKLSDLDLRYIIDTELDISRIFKIAKYTTVYQIIKYLNKFREEEISKRLTLIDYADYISNCEKLKYNLKDDFILFPKNLRAEHDLTSDLVIEKKNVKYDIEIKGMYEEYCNKYEWEYLNYRIVIPKSAMRIVNEGQRLHHCVGSYLERVSNKKTVILFLRKADNPEKNFYTLEVKGKEIIQCRGMLNKSYEDDNELKKVINKFKKDKLETKKSKKVA